MSENYLYGFQSSTVARYLSSASLRLLIATWRKASLFVAATQIQLFLPAPEVDGLRRNRELRVAAEFPGQVMGKNDVPQANPGAMKRLMRLFSSIHTSKCLTLASLLLASSLSVVSSIPPSRFERASA